MSEEITARESVEESVEETSKNPMIVEVEFPRPYLFEGKEYTGLTLDFTGFGGRDMEEISRVWASEGNFSVMQTTDFAFCRMVAERVGGRPRRFFDEMPPAHYTKVHQAVLGFLNV